MQISKPAPRAIIATITGDSGVGKTNLAATFPNPVIIRAEDGVESIPTNLMPDCFPVIGKVDDLWAQLTYLAKEDHSYKTVVIDSVTQLETMFGDWVIDNDPKNPRSLAQANGGYGAGYGAVAALHGRVRNAAKVLNAKGMNVVFIAHSDVTTIEPPDADPYAKYELRLHKKCVTHYVDNVDLVGFLRLETLTKGDGERKKAISSGNRVLVCYAHPAHVSKNRFGINQDLYFEQGINPLIPFIPQLGE